MSLLPFIQRIDNLVTNKAPISAIKSVLVDFQEFAEAFENDHATLKSRHTALKEEHANVKAENAELMAENAQLKAPKTPIIPNRMGTPQGF